jgi:urea carboxylase
MMFRKLLVANRGEIAVRIIRTARRLDLATVAVYSDADRFTLPVRLADEAVRIGTPAAAESYLDGAAILAAARPVPMRCTLATGSCPRTPISPSGCAPRALPSSVPHPSTSACSASSIPRAAASRCGIKLLPGSDLLDGLEAALAAAEAIGYPVMLKSTAGGGGIGMQLCRDADELASRSVSCAGSRLEISAMQGSTWSALNVSARNGGHPDSASASLWLRRRFGRSRNGDSPASSSNALGPDQAAGV